MFVPKDSGTPQERLGRLKDEFNLDPLIVEALLKEHIQNLEEFRFFWDEEAKIGSWCAELRLGDDANVEAAWLWRAWNAVGLYDTGRLSKIGSKSWSPTWTRRWLTVS